MKNNNQVFESNALYSVADVARILRVDVHNVYYWIDIGLLPHIKLKSTKIRGSWIDEFLENNTGKSLTNE